MTPAPITSATFSAWVHLGKCAPWHRLPETFADKGAALRAALDHVHGRGLRHADVLVLPAGQAPGR